MRTRHRAVAQRGAISVERARRAWRERAAIGKSRLALPSIDALQLALDSLAQRDPPRSTATLLLLDLHKFKRINRIFGHAAGSAVLASLEKRFARVIAPIPMFHLGFDEFAFLHCGEELNSPERLAEALIGTLDVPFDILGHSIRLTASIGIACGLDMHLSAEQLLQQASIAQAHARRQGAGKSAFFTLDEAQRQRLAHVLASELPKALRGGEIRPHYQPIVSLTQHSVTGYEALVRWHHPTHGLLLPDTFLSIADEIGLMDELLYAVVQFACDDMQTLPEPVRVAINLSPPQLEHKQVITRLLEIIAASGFSSDLVTIEVTEDRRSTNSDATEQSIVMLRKAGLQIAVDDFGSGYANLQRLAQFPPDSLKIDRELIRACDTKMGHKLLTAVIELGHRLHLPIVAEGIETLAQAQCLTAMGCDYAQGYLFGRPRPSHMLLDERPPFPII